MARRLPILRGRRFGCTACGLCCREDGLVYMTDAEIARMAAHLALSVAAFRRRFGVREDPASESAVVEARDGNGCPLLTPEGVCPVHAVKPAQCATFPFWEEMLDDVNNWKYAMTYCPGLDAPDGRRYAYEEIVQIRAGREGTGGSESGWTPLVGSPSGD